MALIYRIETREGKGVYHAVDTAWDIYPGELKHPGPYADSGLTEYWDECTDKSAHHFGFRDKAQMRSWFYRDEWLAIAKNHGCILAVYDVQEGFYQVGHAQAVFRKDRAELVIRLELI